MLANWVKQAVSVGGTGNLTLGSADSGYVTCNDAIGTNIFFWYSIEDGTSREIGMGYLSASTTLVRSQVRETLVSGTLDRTSPAAINVTTAAKVSIVSSSQSMQGAHSGNFFPSGVITGMCSAGTVSETGTANALTTAHLSAYPFWWPCSKQVSTASVYVVATSASQTARFGIATIAANGKPGVLIKEFTDSATVDCASSGAKVMTPAASFWLPAGWYYILAQGSSATPTFKCPIYSPSGNFLGVISGGGNTFSAFMTNTYGALPTSDLSGNTWTLNSPALSIWLN
jgi:hypothetical protein